MKRFVVVLLLLVVLAAVAKFYVVEIPVVSGTDMVPGLHVGDRLLAYRLDREPRRGDLVLLEKPGGGLLLRRVVGLPGERIATEGETPVINGRAATRRMVREVVLLEGGGKERAMRLVEEELERGVKYVVLKDPRRRSAAAAAVTLTGSYYVLADNRNHGTDSRNFGPVAADKIRAVITHRLTAGDGNLKDQPPRDGWKTLR